MTAPSDAEPWVAFEGCFNFRDVGGYEGAGGMVVRRGRVYRADALNGMTTADVERLTEGVGGLGVRSVVDFRTDEELARWSSAGGPLAGSGLRTYRLPSENPSLAALARGTYEAAELYLWDLERKAADFNALLRVVADERNLPCVLQCSGGKDRTGIMVALLLALLGVSDDAIVTDYALSDAFSLRAPSRYEDALSRVTAAGLDPETLRARPATMARFLDAFRERWRSAEAFALHGGATPEVIAAASANLLEAA